MSNQEPIDIIKKAINSGMNLSHIKDINTFNKKMQGFLTSKHFCYDEGDRLIVGTIHDDIAIIQVDNFTLKITPLLDYGFYDILMSLFEFYSTYKECESVVKENKPMKSGSRIIEDDNGEFWV